MIRNRILWICAIAITTMLASCGVNSNHMFKTAKNKPSARLVDSIPMTPEEDYRIAVDDKISFTLSAKNGQQIVQGLTGISDPQKQEKEMEYVVRRTGEVKLPVVGLVPVEGLTVSECEDTLQNRFAKDFKEPFVQVKVTNQRVIVFPGNGADAQVVPLENARTTLMEALARAGGITDRGKANNILLMRVVNDERVAYQMDLSTLDGGLEYVDMIVQANDYIYVEPKPELSKEIASDIVPVVSLLSSAIFIVSVVNLLK